MANQEREITQKEEKIKELKTSILEQDKRLCFIQSSGFQLANFYFVFQGVILSAIVSGNSSLRCSDRWFLVTLSLLAAVINLFSLIMIGRNYLRSYVERDRTWADCNNLHTELESLKSSSLPSIRTESNQEQSIIGRADTWGKNLRTVCFGICMFLFVCFAVIVLVGCSIIHCRKDDQCKHPISTNDKCIRLCEG